MATHSSILAWEISQTEEPDGLQSTGSQIVRHGWAYMHAWFLKSPPAKNILIWGIWLGDLYRNTIYQKTRFFWKLKLNGSLKVKMHIVFSFCITLHHLFQRTHLFLCLSLFISVQKSTKSRTWILALI